MNCLDHPGHLNCLVHPGPLHFLRRPGFLHCRCRPGFLHCRRYPRHAKAQVRQRNATAQVCPCPRSAHAMPRPRPAHAMPRPRPAHAMPRPMSCPPARAWPTIPPPRPVVLKKMVSDIHQVDEKMDKKAKKEKKNKRVKFALSSPADVMNSSTTAPADSSKLPNSSRKRRFGFLRHIFGKILSFCLPGKSSSSEQKNSDTKTDASSSTAVDRSSEEHRGVDLLAATQETELVTSVVERIKLSPSFDGSFTSADGSFAQETQETKPVADVAAPPAFAAIELECLPNLGNSCYMNSVLQCLLSVSSFQEDVLSQQENWKNKAALLGALSDLHMSRLGSNDYDLKQKHLAKVKSYIENHYPDFKGNQQQDAHEFLMACMSCLKEESESLKKSWPTFTCPVANMEFKLKRERTCNSCSFQKSFTEDFNYLSLVISPQACLTDSLQQYLNASSIDCACRHCSGTKATETLKFFSLPQVLVLMVMRFDIMSSSMCKLKDQLEIPEELKLSCIEAEQQLVQNTVLKKWRATDEEDSST
ncbi:uncharacterized protein LOC143744547 [Siphateles boraxobius]|uniref:uncharacterized protein LOC143744547 n=1 Tax=Siphateles boraxobius TaxID=180520 RepID=UPI0040630F6A